MTSLAICTLTMFRNFNYSNYNTEEENKIMVRMKINTINWSAPEMMVLITSACGEGSDEPACIHDLARAFASRIYKVCRLKKTPNNF